MHLVVLFLMNFLDLWASSPGCQVLHLIKLQLKGPLIKSFIWNFVLRFPFAYLCLFYLLQPIYGFTSGDSLGFKRAVGHKDLFYVDDKDVEFKEVRNYETTLTIVL